jgi:hypothetical protein
MSHPTILVYAPTDVLFTGKAGEGHACNCEPRFILVPRARVPVVGEAKITFRCGIVISLAGANNCEQELLVDGLRVSAHVTQVWFQGAMLYAGHS